MDTDSCIRFTIFFIINVVLAATFRYFRTWAMCADFETENMNDEKTRDKKEDIIMCLQLGCDILKMIFVVVLVLFERKWFSVVEFELWKRYLLLGVVFIVIDAFYNLLAVDMPDRFGTNRAQSKFENHKFILYFLLAFIMPVYKFQKWLKELAASIFNFPDVKPHITIDQIVSVVEMGEAQGIINSVEKDMIDGVMGFNSRVAEEIMTPRTEVFMIDINKDPSEYMDGLAEYRYSRIPVYDDDIDNIIGVIYLKDIFKMVYKEGFGKLDIKKLIKPAYFVPERKNIHALFQEMQREHRHMALLMDEYGGFSGIVTMEDLTEEIMGDIDDEFDTDEPEVYALTTNEAVVQGSTSIKDINDMLGTNFPENMDYDTISGYIINRIGYIPNTNKVEEIEFENVNLKVLEVEDRRIKKVKITLVNTTDEKEDDKKLKD